MPLCTEQFLINHKSTENLLHALILSDKVASTLDWGFRMATYLYGMLFELKINELFDLFNHYIGDIPMLQRLSTFKNSSYLSVKIDHVQ